MVAKGNQIGLKSIWDNSDFLKGFTEYMKALEQATKQTDQSTKQMSNLGGAVGSAMGGIGTASLAASVALGTLAAQGFQAVIHAAGEAIGAIQAFGWESVKTAGRVYELHLVAQLLGQRAGMTEQAIDDQTQAIKDLGIRLDVALTLQAQFARYSLNMAQATDIARVAQDAAVLTMSDSSDTLDRLMWGILTYNQRIIRTAGLNVDMSNAFDRFAKEAGKQAESLAENEKVQAALNAVILEGAKIEGVYETAMGSAAKQSRSFARHVFDLKAAIGAPFQDAWLGIVEGATDFVKALVSAIQPAKQLTHAADGLMQTGGELHGMFVNLGAAAALVADGFKWAAGKIAQTVVGVGDDMGRTFGDVAEDALRWGVNIAVSLADGLIRGATSALVFALDFIAGLLTSWLSPGSPPKLLPDLPKWGMGWMAEILKGMTQADFSALEGIQGPLREALSILEQTGQIGKGAAGAILADLSKQLAKGLAGETVDESVFDKIANAAGGFGEEIADLAKKQIALASSTDEVRKAEEALEQARRKQIAEQQKVSALTAEYNQLLRQGRSPAVLKAKLAEINAAEQARDLAAEQAKAAQEQVDTGKDRVDVLKEQVALQSDLVRQLIDLTRAQIVQPEQPEAGEIGVGDLGVGAAGGALTNLTDSLGKAIDEAKKLLKDKLADIFQPLTDK